MDRWHLSPLYKWTLRLKSSSNEPHPWFRLGCKDATSLEALPNKRLQGIGAKNPSVCRSPNPRMQYLSVALTAAKGRRKIFAWQVRNLCEDALTKKVHTHIMEARRSCVKVNVGTNRRASSAGRVSPNTLNTFGSYLVDPASSHMLVSKIKPCMSKYKRLYCETANGSLNQLWFIWWYLTTWITVVILELIHAGIPDFGRDVFIR